MTDPDLVTTWIRYQMKTSPPEPDPDFAAVEAFFGLEFANPDRLFKLLIKVVEETDDDEVLAMVGASPAEDLICDYGPTYLAPILDLARKHKKWRVVAENIWVGRADTATRHEFISQIHALEFEGSRYYNKT